MKTNLVNSSKTCIIEKQILVNCTWSWKTNSWCNLEVFQFKSEQSLPKFTPTGIISKTFLIQEIWKNRIFTLQQHLTLYWHSWMPFIGLESLDTAQTTHMINISNHKHGHKQYWSWPEYWPTIWHFTDRWTNHWTFYRNVDQSLDTLLLLIL